MELVRYRPGEAIRWLQTGAHNIRRGARDRTKALVDQRGTDQRSVSHNLKTAATAILDLGKGAYTEMVHQHVDTTEFVLQENGFDVVKGQSIQSIPYSRVRKVVMQSERATFTLDKGQFVIKPFAHITSGRAKVPVGWVRNGIEVPFDLLIEELSARCGLSVEED